MLRRVLTVAWRDFKHTVLTKAFLFAIVGVPVLIAAVGGISAVIIATHEEPPLEGTLAVVDPTGDVAEAVAQILAESDAEDAAAEIPSLDAADLLTPDPSQMTLGRGEVRIVIERIDDDGPTIPDDVRSRVQTSDLLGAVWIPPSLLAEPTDRPAERFVLVISEGLDADHIGLIERRVGQAIVRARALRAGIDPDATAALLRRPRATTNRLLAGGTESDESEGRRALKQFLIPIAFMMLLWGASFSSGQQLLMSTIEEKSNKVMEVLLSAVSPLQLMTGKILGQGLAGLIIIAVYASMSILGLVVAAQLDLIEPMQLVLLVVYFFMAYFMVAALMAAVGSAVSDIREANSLLMPVMILLMVPLMLWMPISQSPNGMVATIFSFIPPAIPFAMTLRIAAEDPVPLWQLPATIAWGSA
ncbi:MAG: ABC transporter permease, partial [Phycisphaerae bacterium]|nr:ABC transporter permease [Phycisphaerae bacterium]